MDKFNENNVDIICRFRNNNNSKKFEKGWNFHSLSNVHKIFYKKKFKNILNKKFNSSADMCTDLLNKKGVAILPGSDFGFSIDKMISRLSYTDFDGKNFMSKINLDTTTDDDLIKKYAPKIVEGTKRLKEWVEIG